MQSLYGPAKVDVAFDDPNLVADAGLVPVLALAEQIGLADLVAGHLSILRGTNGAGAHPDRKVLSLLAGMVAGADSIDDIDRLRRTGNRRLFTGIRAPSTLGTFLRAFTHGMNRPPGARHEDHPWKDRADRWSMHARTHQFRRS